MSFDGYREKINHKMKFSIISTDYENWVPRGEVQRGIDSVRNQSYDDFEWIILHDGPKTIPYDREFDFSILKKPPITIETPEKQGCWGLYGRDHVMKHVAKGEFFVQFNINNILYPNFLETLAKNIDEKSCRILIFAIMHNKFNPPFFPGHPSVCSIDMLQLVAHRSIWEQVGYFFDKSNMADGVVYSKMCANNTWCRIEECLGEQF